MFLLRDKLITQGEKRETCTKTCNETMLRDRLRVFVSRICRLYMNFSVEIVEQFQTAGYVVFLKPLPGCRVSQRKSN